MTTPSDAEQGAKSPTRSATRLLRSTFATAAIGGVLLWLAQPPVAWGWLAWVATIPWLAIALRDKPFRRPQYAQLWLAGVLYWVLAVHWVRLPHPLTPIGWVCLACYLGCYLPVFVWLVRTAKRRANAPLWLAAPVAWTGLEFLQAHLFSGFLMGALSHTQAFYPLMVQVADKLGAYGVSFVIMLTTAAVTEWLAQLCASASSITPEDEETAPRRRRGFSTKHQSRVLGAAVAAVCLVLTILDGRAALDQPAGDTELTVALIQGNALAVWGADPAERNKQIMDRQTELSVRAVEQARRDGETIDLVVWPESMFRPQVWSYQDSPAWPPDVVPGLAATRESTATWMRGLAKRMNAPLLVGVDRFDLRTLDESGIPDKVDLYNSSAFISREGELVATYDKTHRVPFGEYIPLAKNLPAMYYLTPMASGLQPGAGPVAMRLQLTQESETTPPEPPVAASRDSVVLSPNICYETVIPHVITGQVRELNNAGTPPDLLVNLTNDAWFWGSSELDMHLACDVFRAVETRTPMIIAANGGLSGVIDARGRVLALSERQTEQALVADAPLRRPGPPSPYVRHGDWFAGGCLIACALVGIIGLIKGERRKGNAE